MLYKMSFLSNKTKSLEPLPFLGFTDLEKAEKDLEQLLSENLFEVLFEDGALMPIFRERSLQAEGDIYALDRNGCLVIFELKRGFAGDDAMLQVLRYGQEAGQWAFNVLDSKYKVFCGKSDVSLAKDHQEAFNLDTALLSSEFNRHQHFVVIGNAANDSLISAVDYWRRQGLSVDFLPYRVYSIGNERYFEFFSLPYDIHQNPASIKGVIFDTNRTWDEDAVWEMMEKRRVSTYGDRKHVVDYLNPRDIIFYSHKWVGVIAAAEVLAGPVKCDGLEQRYRDVRFLTDVPQKQDGSEIARRLTFSQVIEITGKTFFWARIMKVPYLTKEESLKLISELKQVVGR